MRLRRRSAGTIGDLVLPAACGLRPASSPPWRRERRSSPRSADLKGGLYRGRGSWTGQEEGGTEGASLDARSRHRRETSAVVAFGVGLLAF